MNQIAAILVMIPMLITGLVITPLNIEDEKFSEDLCHSIEQKINQQVEDAAVLINGENCKQTETPPAEPNYSEIKGTGYNVKSGFVVDSEEKGNFKAKAQSTATLTSVGYNSLAGVFTVCRDQKTKAIRTTLGLDSSLVGFGTNNKTEEFEFSFNHCRLGEERYLISYSGLSLEKIFEVSREWTQSKNYGELGASKTELIFDSPYGRMKLIYSIDANGYPIIQPHLYEINPDLKKSFVLKKDFSNALNKSVQEWAERTGFPIANYDTNNANFLGRMELLAISRYTSNSYLDLTNLSTTYKSINDCFVVNPKSMGGVNDLWEVKYRETKEGGCLWKPINISQMPDVSLGFASFQAGTQNNLKCQAEKAEVPLQNSCFLRTKVFQTPNDFPTNDGKTNVRYTVLESSYFEETPMGNPEGGIDEKYADNINICTNFSCITNKYELPVQDKEDYPPFPEFPDYNFPEFTPPEYDGQTGIGSGFWQLLVELVGYIVDTIRYMFDEAKNLIQDILFYVIETIEEIADDFLEWLKWFATFVFPENYDFEGLQLLVSDAFENSPATVGVESFRNVFTTIEDEWTARGEANTCKVFYPEVTTGFFKGFKIDICGISQGIDWGLYRGLLSFVIILAGLMTSTKMIYKMITLGKNPAREIVGGE